MFTLIAQDKANHELYGARIAAVAAAIVAGAAALIPALGIAPLALLLSAGAAVASGIAAGMIKEMLDARANKKAAAAGEPLPHSVEGADIAATARGGIVVAIPLAVAWLATSGNLTLT